VLVESVIGRLEDLEYFLAMSVEEDPALSESAGHLRESPGVGCESGEYLIGKDDSRGVRAG